MEKGSEMNDIDTSDRSDKDSLSDDEDEIIDLNDMVLPESEDKDDIPESSAEGSPAPDGDEEILDVLDVAESPSDGIDDVLDLTETTEPSLVDDEAILDLNDTSETPSDIREENADPLPQEDNGTEDLIDSIIENTLELEDIIDEELDLEPEEIDDFVEDLGLDLEEDPELTGLSPVKADNDFEKAIEAITVSPEQIEDAVERVVTKVFTDKIQGLLVSAVEKTVKNEIEKLKALIDDATDDEGA